MYNRFYTIRYFFAELDMGNRLNLNNLNPWIDINPNRGPLTVAMTYIGLDKKGNPEFTIRNTKTWNRVVDLLKRLELDPSYNWIYTGSAFNNEGGAYLEFTDPAIAAAMGAEVFGSSGSAGQTGFGQFRFAESGQNEKSLLVYENRTSMSIFTPVGGAWEPKLDEGTTVTANIWLPGPRKGETIQRLDIPVPRGASGTLFIKDSLGRVTELDPSFLTSNGNQIMTSDGSFVTCFEPSPALQPVQLGWTGFDGIGWSDGQEFRIWV